MENAIKINYSGFWILFLTFFSILFTGCEKENVLGQRPDERLSKALQEHQNKLAEAEHGWKAHLFLPAGGGYSFLFKFDKNNRVQMMADINQTTGSKQEESSYRLRASLLPSLYFDTYSYIHLLADPDKQVMGGVPGWGLFSDFEFSLLSATADTLILKGNLNKSRLELIRATAEEAAAYQGGRLNANRVKLQTYLAQQAFHYVEDKSGTSYSLAFDLERKMLSIMSEEGNKIKTTSFGFAFSGMDELVMSGFFEQGAVRFNKLQLAGEGSTLSLVASDGKEKLKVWPSNQPLFPFLPLWGEIYKQVEVKMEVLTPGNGAAFNTARTTFLANARSNPQLSKATFPRMYLTLDRQEKLLLINQVIQLNGTDYVSYFVFSYTEDGNKLTLKYERAINANAQVIEKAFAPILQGFSQGTIKFDYELQGSKPMVYGQSLRLPEFKFVGAIN